jgi:hypothetical protein
MNFKQKKQYVRKFTKDKRDDLSRLDKWVIKHFGIFYNTFVRNFMRGVIKRSLSKREELFNSNYCAKCGICCNAFNCPALNKKTKLCRIWKYADYSCKVYPFFKCQIDKDEEMKKYCRYYWK